MTFLYGYNKIKLKMKMSNENIIFLFLKQTYIVGTQKNHLNEYELVLLSTQNVC